MPILKAALAASLAFPLISATQDYPGERIVNYPLVHQVMCQGGNLRGTAFRVGKRKMFSVRHVTVNAGCEIDGQPIKVTDSEADNDFSQLTYGKPTDGAFPINCDGFVPGHWYFAIGFARGLPVQTMVTVYATYLKHPNGERILVGPVTFIPGMSGGPVLNDKGEVVGTVNMLIAGTPISMSRELKDTAACRS